MGHQIVSLFHGDEQTDFDRCIYSSEIILMVDV